MEFESVQIGAPDVDQAAEAYTLLLGIEPVRFDGGGYRFQLDRGAVELEAGEPGVRSIRFTGVPADGWPDSFNGVAVRISPGQATSTPDGAGISIDHVVVQTPDADRAIALWRDRAGLRLALDRAFAERGLRLVFFRSGGITLEFAAGEPPAAERSGPDRLWGVSYRVPDLEARRERLVRAGVDVSEIRRGMRPATSVVTVRSGTAGIPTLLLQVDG